MTVLLDALVIAAVAAFLVWAYHYRAAQIRDTSIVHAQLTAIRTALRAHGIDPYAEPATDELPAANVADLPRRPRGTAPRHAAKETA